MVRTIREWMVPALILAGWMVASAYTLSQLGRLPIARVPAAQTQVQQPAALPPMDLGELPNS